MSTTVSVAPVHTQPSSPHHEDASAKESFLAICIHYLEEHLHLAPSCPGAPRARGPNDVRAFCWEHVVPEFSRNLVE